MRTVALVFFALVPFALSAAGIDHFSITTSPQVIEPGVTSAVFTVEAQDASGTPVNGTTVCLEISSSSATGEFSSNGTEWGTPPYRVLAITLSSNQYRRNFYFRDTTVGTHTITVHAVPRPSDTTCPAYDAKANAVWSTSQQVVVGSGGTSAPAVTPSAPSASSAVEAAPPSSPSAPFVSEILAYAGEDRTVFVGADSAFKGYAEGLAGEPLQNARYVWSFGNGDQREGQHILYHFAYPGRYVVVLEVANGLHSASDRVVVTAIPATVAITDVTADYIALKNESAAELDLAGWFLFASGKRFAFPNNTIVVPGQEVLVSNARTGLSGAEPNTVALQYPNGVVASSYVTPLFVARPVAPSLNRGRAAAPAASVAVGAVSDLAEDQVIQNADLITAPVVAAEGVLPRSSPVLIGWLVAVIALVVLGGAGFIFLRREAYSEYSVKEIQ